MNDRQPIKAIGGGTIAYFNNGGDEAGYGRFALISHPGGFVSRYAHLCSWQVFPDDSVVHQGEWIGGAGNTGNVQPEPPNGRCSELTDLPSAHLHFSLEADGTALDATLSGFSIQHLSDIPYPDPDPPPNPDDDPHFSNNSGPGYDSAMNYSTLVRDKYAALGGSLGSTYSSPGGACGNSTRWLHLCTSTKWGSLITQNFISSTGVPSSLTSGVGPTDLWLVAGGFWSVYNFATYGLPLSDAFSPCPPESSPSCASYQPFEGGCIWVDSTGTGHPCGYLYAVTEDSTPDYARLSVGAWVSKGAAPGGSHDLEYYGNGLMLNTPPVSAGGQFRRSTDSGETWTTLSTPDSSRRPVDTARSPNGRLWCS